MTVMQEWHGFRPIDQHAIIEMVCRPLRSVLGSARPVDHTEFTVLRPGVERC